MNCCFSSKHREQITVPAGGTFEYGVKLSVKEPGKFESGLRLWFEDNGIRSVDIGVRGVAVENKE